MADLSELTHCFFCRRELSEGQGRYRFFQGDSLVESCLACYDETKTLLRRMAEEAGDGQITCETEKEFPRKGN